MCAMEELEDLRAYLVGKPHATEEYPFGPETLVLKVAGKLFALVGINEAPLRLTLKCDPIDAPFLRDTYQAIQPGYYMNKRHWNTITLDGSIPPPEIEAMIDTSYKLVVNGLTRAERARLYL